jgi:hypothetical protein
VDVVLSVLAGRSEAVRQTSFTPAKRARFLRVLGETGNVTEAALAAGVKRMTPYNLRRRDEWFARDWDEAMAAALETMAAPEQGELGWVRRSARGTTQLATVRAPLLRTEEQRAGRSKPIRRSAATATFRLHQSGTVNGSDLALDGGERCWAMGRARAPPTVSTRKKWT